MSIKGIEIDTLVVNLAHVTATAFMAFDEKHPNNEELQERARLVLIMVSAIIDAARTVIAEDAASMVGDEVNCNTLRAAIEAADAALKSGES